MKKLIFRFTLPITIISFGLISKWWFGLAVDAKKVFFYGFPFIYKCEGFHTSMSTQYFLIEMILNFLVYFFICFSFTFLIYKFLKFNVSKKVSNIFWIVFMISFSGFIFISNDLDDYYLLKREFEIEIYDSGISLLGNKPDIEKYLD